MAIPLRERVRPRQREAKRTVELLVSADNGMDVEQRIQVLFGAMLKLLQGGDTKLERVLSSDISGGCIELLVTSSSALYVEDSNIAIRIRRWPR